MSTYRQFNIRVVHNSDHLDVNLKLNKHDMHTEANIKALQAITGWSVADVKEVQPQDPQQAEWRKQVAHGQTQLGFTEWKRSTK